MRKNYTVEGDRGRLQFRRLILLACVLCMLPFAPDPSYLQLCSNCEWPGL